MRITGKFLKVTLGVLLVAAAGLVFAQLSPAPAEAPGQKAAAPASRTAPADALQALRNLGKAYYEQGKYAEAAGEFQKVVTSGDAAATDYLSLGMALMQDHKFDAALGALTTARQMDSKLVAAEYNLGILLKREQRFPDAEAALQRVIEADPDDPATWFNLGTVYFAQKKLELALSAHQRVVGMGFGRAQNFYVASLFHSFTILVRLNQRAEAQKILKVHEQVRDKVPGLSLQNPALEGGKYGAILVPPPQALATVASTSRGSVTLVDVTAKLGLAAAAVSPLPLSAKSKPISASQYSLEFARRELVPLFGPSVPVADYDGDGRIDLYLVNPAGPNRLFRQMEDGTFSDVTGRTGVAGPGASLSATFADYDNSQHLSLFVVGLGGVRLYRNRGDGTFTDETAKAGLSGPAGELATRAVLFDADFDGWLDLFVTVYTDLGTPPSKGSCNFPEDFAGAASHFFHNNGDGTFTEMTEASGLALGKGRARGAAFADFNNDGYNDLLIWRDDGPPFLYLNQGENKFINRTAEAGEALSTTVALDAQVADFNRDGNFDLCLWTPAGYRLLLNRGGARFEAGPGSPAVSPPSGPFSWRGTIADLNGDGAPDLLARDIEGKWRFLANGAGRFYELPLRLDVNPQDPLVSIVAASLGKPETLNLVGITRQGHVTVLAGGGIPARWLEVKLTGYKSNTQGVGSILEFKAGNFYNKVVVTQSPVRIFVGNLKRLDVVRATWPNLVVQNSVEVATNQAIEIREAERLSSSCPLLYVWNGEKFVYVSDVLGVAALGALAPDGTRLKPYPEEFVRLPGTLRDRDGTYVFQLTDELREVDFFDRVRLFAVDHPDNEEIYANEIYSSTPSPPTLYRVREKLVPRAAVDEHGHDVLPLVREADGQYVADFSQHRIPGMAELHTLTLDLGDGPASQPITLWLSGWVFWTDSNGARALMSNRQLQMIPPYLQVRDAQGQWVTVIPDLGMPSATNRTMRVDLAGKFLSSDRSVRIGTNLCVYWDQVFFTTDDTAAPPPLELPLTSADLHYRGFSTPISDPRHRIPDTFDYHHLLASAPWNPARGRYTRYGAVDELLREADDHLVAMAVGDELTVEFDGRKLAPVLPGWKRAFFLYLHGWAKDGEPNTAFARSVEPLPFRRMSNYPYREADHPPRHEAYQQYLKEYQSRPGYTLIEPLAPPGPVD